VGLVTINNINTITRTAMVISLHIKVYYSMGESCRCLYPPLASIDPVKRVVNPGSRRNSREFSRSIDNSSLLGQIRTYGGAHGSPYVASLDILGKDPPGTSRCRGPTTELLYNHINDAASLIDAVSMGYLAIITFTKYNDSMLFWRRQTPDQRPIGVMSAVVIGYDIKDSWFILRCHNGSNWGDRGNSYYPTRDWGTHSYCVVVTGHKPHPKSCCEIS